MSAHTPGPWEFDGDYVWAVSIAGYVADVNTEDMTSGDAVPLRNVPAAIKANGRLIAAAPELLAALEGLLADITEYQTLNKLGGENNHSQVVARAAIAKARSA